MTSDDELVAAWLARYPRNTSRAYRRDIELFMPELYGRTLRDIDDAEAAAYGAIMVKAAPNHMWGHTHSKRVKSTKGAPPEWRDPKVPYRVSLVV